ncbi:LCP family protein [Austwickia chelonae]|uniref:LCP family protein n=1 Tax=Austwickia chelonae TaxID=100225 RepID=UPI0013C3095F|nr:LCP family protein [Austwickia chelonae]
MVVILLLLGYIGVEYVNLDRGLNRSDAVKEAHGGAVREPTGDVNILLMGLDSRLDLRGNPLAKDVYDAMHTGNSTIGGMNTNVLMLLHLPGGGRPATVIQIPRDDFVDFPGCPRNKCDGKIKEAYNAAFQARQEELQGMAGLGDEEKHRQARDAGRAQSIRTVEAFLGKSVVVDHFIEVTMVAFYEIAQVVQPVTVCLKQDTKDSYSGADFKAGKQQISAEQAMSFVRQRRDALGDTAFSDLDRERRQQAFMASLAHQLKQKDTFVNPSRLDGLIGVAKKNVAVSEGLSPLDLARQAKQLTDGKVTFYTLPVVEFFTDKYGSSANRVDVPRIQATVAELLSAGKDVPEPAPSTPAAPKPTVSVVNASGVNGAASGLADGLASVGYGKGGVGNAPTIQVGTFVQHAPGEAGLAATLITLLGPEATPLESDELKSGTLRVTLGTNFRMPAGLGGAGSPGTPGSAAPSSTTSTPAPLPPSTVGTGAKNEDTSATTLTALSGGGIPCVK